MVLEDDQYEQGDYDGEYTPDYQQEPSGYEDDADVEQDETASRTSEYDDAEVVIRCWRPTAACRLAADRLFVRLQ
jgi:hypothetical protein